jgi:hypothetical protein
MLTRALSLVHIDFAPQHRQPSWPRVIVASLAAIVGSLVVTRVSSRPRWLFGVSAIVVTLVLWLPDLYILHGGAPGKAVAVLMVMHLAIAVVTYNCLVRIAPVRPFPAPPGTARPGAAQSGRHASHRV